MRRDRKRGVQFVHVCSIVVLCSLFSVHVAALDLNSSHELRYHGMDTRLFEVDLDGTATFYNTLQLQDNNIQNPDEITGFFDTTGCASGEAVNRIYTNGSYDCVNLDDEVSTPGLSDVLAVNNTANQSIDIGGNNISQLDNILTGGQTVAVRDSTNQQDIVQFAEDSQNVRIPHGDLDVVGNATFNDSIEQHPADPRVIANVTDGTDLNRPWPVEVSGGYAYVSGRASQRFTIVDVRNESDPEIVGSVQDSDDLDFVFDIDVAGKYAYTAPWSSHKMTVVDISDPSSPSVAGTAQTENTNNPSSVEVQGQYAYFSAWDDDTITVFDISDPTNPIEVANLTDTTDLDGVYELAVRGDYLYAAVNNADAMTVVDISDPENPSIAGSVSDSTDMNAPRDIVVSGRYAYIGSDASDISVVDIADPANPTLLTHHGNGDSTAQLDISGDYAYVQAGTVSIVDISDPANLQQIANKDVSSGLRGIDVVGTHGFVADNADDALHVLELTGIDAPTASIGSLWADSLQVRNSLDIGRRLTVASGLNVGPSGIKTDGDMQADKVQTESVASDGRMCIGNRC